MRQQKYDIITGIPSFNEKDNIAFVTRQLGRGLQKYFPKSNSLVVDCDNGSTDNTKRVFLKAKTTIEKKRIPLPLDFCVLCFILTLHNTFNIPNTNIQAFY